MQPNKSFQAVIVTRSGKRFSFVWHCTVSAIMHNSPAEVFMLADNFKVASTLSGGETIVPTGSIDYYSLKPLANLAIVPK